MADRNQSLSPTLCSHHLFRVCSQMIWSFKGVRAPNTSHLSFLFLGFFITSPTADFTSCVQSIASCTRNLLYQYFSNQMCKMYLPSYFSAQNALMSIWGAAKAKREALFCFLWLPKARLWLAQDYPLFSHKHDKRAREGFASILPIRQPTEGWVIILAAALMWWRLLFPELISLILHLFHAL